jgi:hypothetical protein
MTRAQTRRHARRACSPLRFRYPMNPISRYELAQLNIAVMKEPLESARMADFVANLDRINAVAEASAGFVWRLQTEQGDATGMRPMGEDTLALRTKGPTQDAFTFRHAFPPPDAPEPGTAFALGGQCPAT